MTALLAARRCQQRARMFVALAHWGNPTDAEALDAMVMAHNYARAGVKLLANAEREAHDERGD